jgi:transformation/transcription domain-associated protein
MMIEPQALDYKDTDDSDGPRFSIYFHEHKDPIELPVKKVIETAFNALKSSSTEPGFYRKQCWEVIKSYLVASLQLDDDKSTLLKLLAHPSFREGPINSIQGPQYRCLDKQARSVHQMAVTGMFVAAAIKELRQAVLPTMVALVRHYTMVAIAQQAGPFPMTSKQNKLTGMDPLVLIDAMAVIMGHEEKELCKPGHLAMVLILDTATNILGSKERACRLPIMEILAEKMCNLCYERAWYAKLGGCIAIKFLFERMDLRWVFQHQFSFLKALLFVMMDSTGEVSSGAVDMAKSNLEKMLQLCASPLEESTSYMKEVQDKSLADVVRELVRQVTSPNNFVRDQAMNSLKVLAEITKTPVTDVMAPHKDVLQDMIPPRKHLLRHQPVNAQIGLMDGNTFCTTLEPRLFTIDLKIMEHKVFFTELLSLCEADDPSLQKLPCYKNINNLVPLRKSALRALAACHYIPECREKIFQVLFKALNSNNNDLVESGFECMKKFLEGHSMEPDIVVNTCRSLVQTAQDFKFINLNLLLRLNYLAQLFPSAFADTKLCEYLLGDLRKWLEQAIVAYKQNLQNGQNKNVGHQQLRVAASILKLYQQIPVTIPVTTLIDMLCKLVLATEKTMLMEPGSILREPLMNSLCRYANETVDYFLSENQLKDPKAARFMGFMLNHPDGQVLRDALKSKVDKLVLILESVHNGLVSKPEESNPNLVSLTEMQFSCISTIHMLVKHDKDWIKNQDRLIVALRNVWNHDSYHDKHHNGDHQRVDYAHWREPKLIVKVLLEYFKANPDSEILLLFYILRALCGRFVADFQFLKDYLENEICAKFSVDWKRAAFFEFIRRWKTPDAALSQDLMAKILQYIIIPAFANSFEKGETDAIIGSAPAPEVESETNVVSSFITNVIDPGNASAYQVTDAVSAHLQHRQQ